MRFDGSKLVAIRDSKAEQSNKKKSQIELEIAAQTGVSYRTLQRWMGGHTTPSSTDLISLSKACEVEPEVFFIVGPADPMKP